MSEPISAVKRRPQEDRRKTMRKRLITATIESLALEGYSATTLRTIVLRAGVSRGALGHHYSTKNEIILDAANDLLTRAYRRLGDVLLGIADEDDRLRALVITLWDEIFSQPAGSAFVELVVASRHEPTLSNTFRTMYSHLTKVTEEPVNHYFEKREASNEAPIDVFLTLINLMIGLNVTNALASPNNLQAELDNIYRMISQHLKARRGVTTPPTPPKPLSP